MEQIKEQIEKMATDDGRFQLTFALVAGTRVPADISVMGDVDGAPVARLNFSYFFRPNDLVIDDRGVSQTLSFGGRLFKVFVPYANIIQAASDWDLRATIAAPVPTGPRLRLVTGDENDQ